MIAPLEADWWGPYNDPQQPLHVPHGLPVTGMPLAGPVESRPAEPEVGVADRRMPRPPNPQAVFAAARFGFASSRLIALAYLRNALQYWDPHAARWHLLTGEKQAAELIFSASEYAWLPASGPGARLGEVALIPTQQGLMRLFINPVSETYHTEAVLKATPASAPGAVGRHIACLIHHNGGMRLWCAQADAEQTHLINCDELNLPTAAGRARFPTMEN